jgi:hypothetical protein
MFCLILLTPWLLCVPAAGTCRRLEEKARELEVPDVRGFLSSQLFATSGFSLDAAAGKITCRAI